MRGALLDDGVLGLLVERSRRTASEFGKQLADGPLPRLDWGEQPEFRPAGGGRPPTIFLSRHEPDWWRIRYQIAHEVFHWLCTPPRTFHWAHELLAVETAVRAMQELGEHEYAGRVTTTLRREAELLPLEAMLTTPFRDRPPDGLYGRAWVTGRELQGAIGWESLKPLASSFGEDGRPDVAGWVRGLSSDEQASVETLLGAPSPNWV